MAIFSINYMPFSKSMMTVATNLWPCLKNDYKYLNQILYSDK